MLLLLDSIVLNSSFSNKNLEVKPLGEYRFLRVFYASKGVLIFLMWSKGPSDIANLIKAKALLALTNSSCLASVVRIGIGVVESIIASSNPFSISIDSILKLYIS